MRNTAAVCRICLLLFFLNLVMFGIKLYIGLASNSISIFSDSINNLFDSLSLLLTFAVLTVIMRTADKNTASMAEKGEQLFSFLFSVVIVFTGFYFAYSSLERFMYPTPVWYTYTYLTVIAATAAVKLLIFVFLKKTGKRLSSDVLGMVAFDSLLDFFITSATVLTLVLSGTVRFSFDALFGLLISIAIIVPAVKMMIDSGKSLINYVPAPLRYRVNRVIDERGIGDRLLYIKYLRAGNETEACAFFSSLDFNSEELCEKVYETTGIRLFAILQTKGEKQ
ncbi:MAG: cation diffusion facilitator family transporter [Clostridia bacterium]|nr:cation diffusion facilitator family transporter [Clostridia bacterium]